MPKLPKTATIISKMEAYLYCMEGNLPILHEFCLINRYDYGAFMAACRKNKQLEAARQRLLCQRLVYCERVLVAREITAPAFIALAEYTRQQMSEAPLFTALETLDKILAADEAMAHEWPPESAEATHSREETLGMDFSDDWEVDFDGDLG